MASKGRPEKPLEYAPDGQLYLGSLIRAGRKKQGLSVSTLANLLSYDQSNFSKIETNLLTPSMEQLGKLSHILGIPLEALQRAPVKEKAKNKEKQECKPTIAQVLTAINDELIQLRMQVARLERVQQRLVIPVRGQGSLRDSDFSTNGEDNLPEEELEEAPINNEQSLEMALIDEMTNYYCRTGYVWEYGRGLPTDTLPVTSDSYVTRFYETFSSYEGERTLLTRQLRAKRTEAHLEQGQCDYRYIIPQTAIERYVLHGLPNLDEIEAGLANWRAPLDERIARIEKLLHFLQYPKYNIALADAPYSGSWWCIFMCKAGSTIRHDVVLSSVYLGKPRLAIPCIVKEASTIAECRQTFQEIWDALPATAKNKPDVTQWLTELLHVVRT